MQDNAQTVYLDLQVDLSHTLTFRDDHGVLVTPHLQMIGEDEYEVAPVSLEGMVDAFVDDQKVKGDYRRIYCVAHEMRRLGEKLGDLAQSMEDSLEAVADRYNIDPEDLQ